MEHGPGLRELRRGVVAPGEPAARPALEGDTLLLDLAAAAAGNAPLREALRCLAAEADIVLHFSPWSARACRDHGRPEAFAPAGFMLGAVLEGLRGPGLEAAWAELWALENALCQRAALLLSPGPLEAAAFRLLYGVPPEAMVEAGALPPSGHLARLAAERPPPAPRRPVTLALNDYPWQEPRNGGAVRSLGLLGGLSRDVVAVTLGPQPRFVPHGDALLEVCLPRPAAQRALGRSLQRIADAPIHDLLGAAHAADMPLLATLLGGLGPRLDAVVFEHPYMAPILPAVRRAAGPDPVPVILHAHNVEGPLKAELLEGHPLATLATGFAEELERGLAATAALVLCCSEADAAHFRAQGREVLVVPHDAVLTDEPPSRPAVAGPPRCGFLASAHRPNRAAARFIAEELAPAFPKVTFDIVGSVGDTLAAPLPTNVVRHGVLPPARMREVLSGWSVALNPVETGGGASVKLAEYLALGLPSISTPHAARGFEAAVGAGLVVPLEGFADALRRLLSTPGDREALAEAARRHWASPARRAPLIAAREAVAVLAGARAVPRAPRRLLAVTDGSLPERAACFDAALEGLLPLFSEVEVRRVVVPPAQPSPERQEVLGREAEAILAGFAPLLPQDAPPMPWTGLLPPVPGRAGRQASARFALLLPARTAWVQLRLLAPRPFTLRLQLRTPEGAKLGVLRARRATAGQSLLELDLSHLATAHPTLLMVKVPDAARWKGSDGLRVLQLACGEADGEARLADLRRDAMDTYRAAFPQHWREAAWRAADRRGPAQRALLENGQPLAETIRAALAEAGGAPDDLLVPAEAAAPAGPPGGPRVLAIAPGGLDLFGTVPESTGAGLRAAAAAVAAFPGIWPVRPALGGTLRRLRALEEVPLHRVARGRAALGLRQPYLLAASLDGPLPLAAGALHALTASLGLDLVLAGDGKARRLPPEGGAVDAAVPVAGLLGVTGIECCGLWLPEPAVDERALIALGWLSGAPVMAASANWYARQAVQQSVSGLLLRPPQWHSLEALLRQPALREALSRGGTDALRRWLHADRDWPS